MKNVRNEVKFIRDELTGMKDALEGLSDLDELDTQTKRWRDIVREMSYDIEEIIDDFMQNIGNTNRNIGFRTKMLQRLKTLMARHRVAGQIEEVKKLVLETSARRKRYKLDIPLLSNVVAIDPRVKTLYQKVVNLVGMEEPKNKLVNWIIDGAKELKVVSVVGFGGLGKTTLANLVYGKLKVKFERCAFVPVSQKPDITKLLRSLLLQLGGMAPSRDCELNVLLDELREYLQDKRYLIVIDDIWDIEAWSFIKCAFPENDLGSRIFWDIMISTVKTKLSFRPAASRWKQVASRLSSFATTRSEQKTGYT
ncbi:hypothetical protein ZWY2020_028350 [Hordeum vulgare]|nr:hypothetical protein ZWY2020_028350 [Hordeum vulgare]